jgi:hypothetical protein
MKVNIGPYPTSRSRKPRKESVQIHPYDTWGMDNTLAMIIAPMLKQLRETTNAYPCDFPCLEVWQITLDRMHYAFEACLNDYNSDKYHLTCHGGETHTITYEVEDDDGRRAERHIVRNERYDMELHELELNKIRHGFELFGKYYMSLWD